jgi:chemotaxis protein CheD
LTEASKKKPGVLFHGENTSQANRDGKIPPGIFYCEKDEEVNIVVGLSDMKVSNDQDAVLISYSLGSCIGIMIYDPVPKIGGLLNFMLPESTLDAEKGRKNPCMFGDTGIPALFKAATERGAVKERMKVIVAGGAQIIDQGTFLNIGEKNILAVQNIFSGLNVVPSIQEVGGYVNRTVKLLINSGEAWLKVSGQEFKKL